MYETYIYNPIGNDMEFRSAVYHGQIELVEYLLKCGADVHAENDEALFDAIENSDIKMVGLLLRHDPNLSPTALNGKAVGLSLCCHAFTISKLLIDHGSKFSLCQVTKNKKLQYYNWN